MFSIPLFQTLEPRTPTDRSTNTVFNSNGCNIIQFQYLSQCELFEGRRLEATLLLGMTVREPHLPLHSTAFRFLCRYCNEKRIGSFYMLQNYNWLFS